MEEMCTGKFLSLKKQGTWEYVERKGCSSAVIIIPITYNNEVILVEQMRIPLGRNVIEFPAGLVGDDCPTEEYIDAATRELKEETGYVPVGESYDYFGEFCTSPGLTNEKVHMLRLAVKKECDSEPEEGITVHVVPLSELRSWLREKSKTCDVSVKTFLYAMKCEDCRCTVEEECEIVECCCEDEEKSLLHRVTKSFFDNMVQWTIIICISLSIGSCTIKEIVNAWK